MINAILIMLNSGGWGEDGAKVCDVFGFVAVPSALIFGMLRARKAARA